MLNWTGHPLVDVGIAVILAFANKRDPETLTEDDLSEVADYIEQNFVRNPLKSFLNVAFPNSGFTQPAFEKEPERRVTYARNVARAFGTSAEHTEDRCVFTGRPTPKVIYHDTAKPEYAPGRAYRQHIPLTLGVEFINFYAEGAPGLPVSGEAMLAIHAMPLGCAKVGGRLLAVHADSPDLTRFFARKFLDENLRAISIAQAANESKLPGSVHSARTLLIRTLTEAHQRQMDRDEEEFVSLTAYALTNSGQGADLTIHYLPSPIIGFLSTVQGASYAPTWNRIVAAAWEQEPRAQQKKRQPDDEAFQPRRNRLYEDVWGLPQGARYFLRTYFLRVALRTAKADQGDPRATYSLAREADLVSWPLTALFLRRIMNMEKERIEEIRRLGDGLASYIRDENDRRFFRNFATVSRYGDLRLLLIKASNDYARQGAAPFLTLDNFLAVFEEGDEIARPDWRLSRDLLLIRVVEQLYQHGWLSQHKEELEAVAEVQASLLEGEVASATDDKA